MIFTVVFHGVCESATGSGLNLVLSALSLEREVNVILMPDAYLQLNSQPSNTLKDKFTLIKDFHTCQILICAAAFQSYNLFGFEIPAVSTQQFRQIIGESLHCFYF